MKFSLKMTLGMVGLLSVLFGAGGSLLISASFQTSLDREREEAYRTYQMVLGTLQVVNTVGGPSDYPGIARTLGELSGQRAGSWTALRLGSATENLYTYGPAIPAGSEPARADIVTIRYVSAGPEDHALVLSGALDAGRETLYLDMARDISPLFETRLAQEQTYRAAFLLMVGLCAVLSFGLSRLLTQPLVGLSNASRAIAAGKLGTRARVRSNDEVGLVARDFNAMAQALEDNIGQLKASVERQERFLGGFAHELKTPMTSIIGYADLLRGQTLSAEEQVQAANYIFTEGRRLENLSQKLLELLVVKQGEVPLSPVRPAALIQGLQAHLGPVYARQGITLTCDCADGACLLEPELVKSLLLNLWDNARKAMDGRGGVIEVRLDMLPDGCRIAVRDTGRGIPPDALDHLTEAFYRVDKSRAREQGGVGLGLAQCREIADLHGGGLRFESAVGAGTTVTVELRGGAA